MNNDKMCSAFESLLNKLPECKASLSSLCLAAEYFDIESREVLKAAEDISFNHQLCYAGVRKLLSLCLEELAAEFEDDGKKTCFVSVPAPACAIYALQKAAPDISFRSSAFFAQIFLRGILQNKTALDMSSCSKRRCGLNKMYYRFLCFPPVKLPEYQLIFGVLCDECAKTGEDIGGMKRFILSFPENLKNASAVVNGFYKRLCNEFAFTPASNELKYAYALYGRLLSAEKRILELCSRDDREALWGNSLALAQSVQLMSSPRIEEFIDALELLVHELESAPYNEGQKRIYCFYIPFLQPDVERQFRENGVALLGNAAFLESKKSLGLGLGGMTAAWLESMALRTGPAEQCALIAAEMERMGCMTYLTGAFNFDRRMGALLPLQRKILKQEHSITTHVLDADFWCENAMFGSLDERIDHICDRCQ